MSGTENYTYTELQTSGTGFVFIYIFQVIIELLEHINYSFYIIIYTLRAYGILLLHLGNLHVNMRAEDLSHAR